MVAIAEKTEKQIKFDKWLEELRSGNYVQGDGALHAQDGDVETYCCVGILDEKVYGTQWHADDYPDSPDYMVYSDDEGETELMDSTRVEDMDLHLELTVEEINYFSDKNILITGKKTRISSLAAANDFGHTFESIADYIEELGWNA